MQELSFEQVEEVSGGMVPVAWIVGMWVVDAALIGFMVGMQQEMAKQP